MSLTRAIALIEAAHSASDAPWRRMPTPNRDSVLCESGTIAVLSFPDDCKHKENAAFIALSRNDAPAIAEGLLLAEQFAKDILAGFENPDVSHLNFRITAAKLATEFLAKMENGNG